MKDIVTIYLDEIVSLEINTKPEEIEVEMLDKKKANRKEFNQ
jgi:hypothetical protein